MSLGPKPSQTASAPGPLSRLADAESRESGEHFQVATDPDAKIITDAEIVLESELPTPRLSLFEAQEWINHISFAEDIDPPKLYHFPISQQFDALAVADEHVIVVRTAQPSKLTLLHEMAHFLGAMNHGAEFRQTYIDLLRRHVSQSHALLLAATVKKH